MRLTVLLLLAYFSLAQALDTVSIVTVNPEIREPTNGTAGTPAQAFRLSRGLATTGALVVNLTIDGTAGAGDYAMADAESGGNAIVVPGNRQVTIPNGSSEITLWITPTDDNTVEGRETVRVTIAVPGGGSDDYLRDAQPTKTVLIADNDLVLGWTMVEDVCSEDLAGALPPEGVLRLSFWDANGNAVTAALPTVDVRFRVLGGAGQATLSSDYLMTYMWRHAGLPGGNNILNDRSTTLNTGNETWTWNTLVADDDIEAGDADVLVNDTSRLHVNDLITFGSVTDELYRVSGLPDATTLEIFGGLIEDDSAADGDPVRNNIEPNITTNGSTQGIGLNGTYYAFDIAITPKYDNQPEGSEAATFQLLSSPDYIIRSPNDIVMTIADDDVLVWVEAVDDAVRSTSTTGTIRVHLSAAAPKDITIPLTIGGTAVAGTDYTAVTASITVPAGSTSQDIEVQAITGGGTGTVSVTLVDTVDIVIAGSGPSQGQTATINVRDGTGSVTFGSVTITADVASTPDSVVGATPASFLVEVARSGDDNPVITVPLLIGGTALPGTDYTALPASVEIPRLFIAAAVSSSATYAFLKAPSGTVELPVGTTLRIGAGGAAVTRTVKTAASVATTATVVELTTAIGGAFAADTSVGVNQVSVPVTAVLDALAESNETVTVTLLRSSTTANYTLGTPAEATVTVADTALVPSKPSPSGLGESSSSCGAGGLAGVLIGMLALAGLRRRRR